MNVYTNFAGNYAWDPIRNLHFDEIDAPRDDIDLYIGVRQTTPVNADNINVYIDFEQPNIWYGGPDDMPFKHALSREKTFDKIYSIHEPVVAKRNKLLGVEKYGYCFFPFSLKHEPEQPEQKKYDLFFSGHWYGNNYCLQREIIGPAIHNLKNKINNFDYFIVSGYGNGKNLSYDDKLRENAKSRISIAYNHQEMSPRFLHRREMLQNEFTDIRKDRTGHYCINQHKARVIEGFMSKTLVLIYHDPYNSIEDFWTPDEHFIYYYDKEDLTSKVIDINKNYYSDKYQNIINAGYEHTKNEHNTQQFYNKYLKDL